MKKIKNIEDNDKMKELSSTILFEEKSNISFYEQGLDDKSLYTYLFFTSIYHNKIDELKEHLKLQFYYESKYTITKDEYLTTKDNFFDIGMTKLNLNTKEEKTDIKTNINTNNIFVLMFFITLLIPLLQFSFIYAINKEYIINNNNYYYSVNDIKIKIIKYLFLLCIILKTYLEFINGKKIVIYCIYTGFLYRSFLKRLLSILMGLVQILINLIIYIYFYQFLFQVESIIKCIEIFCVFIVVSQLNNWICEIYFNCSNELKNI